VVGRIGRDQVEDYARRKGVDLRGGRALARAQRRSSGPELISVWVHRLVPMVIRLTDRQIASCDLQPLRLKLDPGSKTTGLALVRFDMQALQNPEISGVEYQQGTLPTLTLKATGRGSYQRTRLDKFGFPRGYLMRTKRVHGFGTGDMVRAEVPAGVKAGIHIGRVAVRASGSFNIQSYQDGQSVVVQGISHKHCRVIQRADGYGYFFNRANNAKREQARPQARNAARSALYLPGMNAEVSRAN
jgi:hypothetical protein